jgi:hypothetical protein
MPTQNHQPHRTNKQQLASNTKSKAEKNNIKKNEPVKNNGLNIFGCGKGFHLQTIKKGSRSIYQLLLPIQINAMKHKTFLPKLDNHTKNIISLTTY